MKAITEGETEKYMSQILGWSLTPDSKKISQEFKFPDFKEAMKFVNKIADIAEEEGHHPDIHIFYNRVMIELWTHAVNGLSENDFIVATKINAIK